MTYCNGHYELINYKNELRNEAQGKVWRKLTRVAWEGGRWCSCRMPSIMASNDFWIAG